MYIKYEILEVFVKSDIKSESSGHTQEGISWPPYDSSMMTKYEKMKWYESEKSDAISWRLTRLLPQQ